MFFLVFTRAHGKSTFKKHNCFFDSNRKKQSLTYFTGTDCKKSVGKNVYLPKKRISWI
jgi:hypothetical protein